jgi:2-oxo-4-hydroxy-4-carboxy--5-ureidoimidazoline (OHCU) decarboxylase
MLMATRIVRKAVDDFEPQLAIEPWRLEAVSCEHHLKTTAAARLCFRQFEQTSTNPPPALLLMHPDLANLAAPAPGVPAESSD